VIGIQKPLSGFKNILQNPHEAFQGLGSIFSELHAKLDADTLLNLAIHRRQNETLSHQKSTRVKIMRDHSAVPHGTLMQ
jgi:hypothetical protein